VRSQFKTAIGKFEGIEEPARPHRGELYMMDAARADDRRRRRPR